MSLRPNKLGYYHSATTYLVVLVASLKHSRKDFQVITGHSAFITSKSLFVPANMV